MTALGFVMLTLVWSGMLWIAAKLLVMIGPSPKLAQTIWRGAAVLMILPFAAAFLYSVIPDARSLPLPDLPLIEVTIGDVMRSGVSLESTRPTQTPPSVETFIGYLLVTGWALRLVVMGLGQMRLQHLKKISRPTDLSAARWAGALNLKKAPLVKMIPDGSPFVAGIRNRLIFVPEALASIDSIQQVIAHECVHLARGDLVARPIERLMADIFWISPFAWLIRAELDYWREAVVDDVTTDLTGDRLAYARALTLAARVARPKKMMPVAAFILPRKSTLKMRVTMLLDTTPYRSSRAGLAAAAFGILIVPIGLVQGAGLQTLPTNQFSSSIMDTAHVMTKYGNVMYPGKAKPHWHEGVDLANEYGASVRSPCDGKIISVAKDDSYGINIKLVSESGVKLRFAILSSAKVKEGQSIKAGDLIGTVGAPKGDMSKSHVHVEVWKGQPTLNGKETAMKSMDPFLLDGLILADKLYLTDGSALISNKVS